MSFCRAAARGMMWTGLDQVGSFVARFVIGLVLARLLTPEDYGVIGILTVFLALATTFVDSGFASALIQKQGRTQEDYSVVFYFNVAMAVAFYAVLFLSAPYLARFYNLPILRDVTRVIALTLIIGALSSAQLTKLTIDLRFKMQAGISFFSLLASGIVGIIMAFLGFGVWALVAQSVFGALLKTILVVLVTRWRPLLVFPVSSFKSLFSFGSKLLAAGLINTVYTNLYSLVIGKVFGPRDLGEFSRANSFASLGPNIVLNTAMKVNYPMLAKYQNDDALLIRQYKTLIRFPLYALVPALFCLFALAEPLVVATIGEKWLGCVPMLQVLCIGYCLFPMTNINLTLLNVKGRTDLVLKLEIIKKAVAVSLVFVAIPFGVFWMCVAKATYDILSCVFNCYYTGKLLGYGLIRQIIDIMPIVLRSLVVLVAVKCLTVFVPLSPILQLFCGAITGVAAFVLIGIATHDEVLRLLYGKFRVLRLRAHS